VDFLPFARPTLDEAMIAAVADTLRSRWLVTGPRVAAFEKALSERFGGRPVRALTSATAAMQVALELLGIGPGDEVIIPAQSFFVTGNVVERAGATAVFVDVNLGSRNIDLAQAAAAVTPKTRLLFPTHYNAPLDPEVLDAFAERHKVRILEDAHLVTTTKVGRVRQCRIDTAALKTVEDWISERRNRWERRLDRLGDYLVENPHPRTTRRTS